MAKDYHEEDITFSARLRTNNPNPNSKTCWRQDITVSEGWHTGRLGIDSAMKPTPLASTH